MRNLKSPLLAAAVGCMLVAGPVAHAQNARPAAEGPDTVEIYTDADAAAVLNARIAALRIVLDLTPDQQKLWSPVEASIRKIAAASIARGKQRADASPPASFLDVLERIGDAEATRAEDLKSFVAAARPLVASLTDAQKNRIPAFLGMMVKDGSPLSTQSLWLFEEEER